MAVNGLLLGRAGGDKVEEKHGNKDQGDTSSEQRPGGGQAVFE